MGRYSIVLLQTTPRNRKAAATDSEAASTLRISKAECWRAAVACDGMLVIEGPETDRKARALNLLLDSTAAKLARCIPRAWDESGEGSDSEGDGGETGVEDDTAGCKFASERRRR